MAPFWNWFKNELSTRMDDGRSGLTLAEITTKVNTMKNGAGEGDLTKNEKKEIEEIFTAMDSNGSGDVSAHEAKVVYKNFRKQCPDPQSQHQGPPHGE